MLLSWGVLIIPDALEGVKQGMVGAQFIESFKQVSGE